MGRQRYGGLVSAAGPAARRLGGLVARRSWPRPRGVRLPLGPVGLLRPMLAYGRRLTWLSWCLSTGIGRSGTSTPQIEQVRRLCTGRQRLSASRAASEFRPLPDTHRVHRPPLGLESVPLDTESDRRVEILGRNAGAVPGQRLDQLANHEPVRAAAAAMGGELPDQIAKRVGQDLGRGRALGHETVFTRLRKRKKEPSGPRGRRGSLQGGNAQVAVTRDHQGRPLSLACALSDSGLAIVNELLR